MLKALTSRYMRQLQREILRHCIAVCFVFRVDFVARGRVTRIKRDREVSWFLFFDEVEEDHCEAIES